MDKEYLVKLLTEMSSKYNLNIDAEILGKIVNMSSFRIVEKGTIGTGSVIRGRGCRGCL